MRHPDHPCFLECQRLAARGVPCGAECDYQDWKAPESSSRTDDDDPMEAGDASWCIDPDMGAR